MVICKVNKLIALLFFVFGCVYEIETDKTKKVSTETKKITEIIGRFTITREINKTDQFRVLPDKSKPNRSIENSETNLIDFSDSDSDVSKNENLPTDTVDFEYKIFRDLSEDENIQNENKLTLYQPLLGGNS